MTLLDMHPAPPSDAAHRPWPRVAVGDDGWREAIEQLADGRLRRCSGCGAKPDACTWRCCESGPATIARRQPGLPGRASFLRVGGASSAGASASSARSAISSGWSAMARPTRGPGSITAAGACAHPLGTKRRARERRAAYRFLPAEGEGLHQIPVGPVHAGIIEPGHFRFTANGETVVRLEERLGYVHKGIEALMAGAPLDAAAKLAGRASGDSTVAYALAFARAAEAALRHRRRRRARICCAR